MLFVVDTGLSSEAELGNQEAIRIINDLCTSVKYGRHSLYAEREVLHSIKTNVLLNLDSRGIASHILDSYSMKYGDVLNHIKRYIRLSKDAEKVSLDIKQDGGCEYTVPIKSIKDDSFFRESVLLLENSAESEFYQLLAHLYASIINYYISFKIEPDLGGGDTTSRELKKHIDSMRICLCICDSDVSFPGCQLGETYNKCLSVTNKDWPLCRVISTFPFREIENLIPEGSLRRMGIKDGNIRDYCNDLSLVSTFDSSMSYYLDVKKGLNYKGLHLMDTAGKSFYQTVLTGSGILSESQVKEIDSLKADELQTKGTRIIIHGCGSSILSSFLTVYSGINADDLSDNQKDTCLDLGSLVYHLGFCYGRIVM